MRPKHTNRLQFTFRKILSSQKHALSCMSRKCDSLTYHEIRILTSWTGGELCGQYKGVPIAQMEYKKTKNKVKLENAGIKLKNPQKSGQMSFKRVDGTLEGRKCNPQHIHDEKYMHLEACQGIAIP